MSLVQALKSSRLSWLLCATIIATWIVVAFALEQSVIAVQHSRQLLHYGAIDGALLQSGEWWRVLASQFLHVHAPHMLFNALAVLGVGAILEAGVGRWWLAFVYVVGGSIGQIAGVAFYPSLVSSGASQALMAICGAALVMRRTRFAYPLVVPILVLQIGLDLNAAGTIKAGHGWGFMAGVVIGGAIVVVFRRNVTARL